MTQNGRKLVGALAALLAIGMLLAGLLVNQREPGTTAHMPLSNDLSTPADRVSVAHANSRHTPSQGLDGGVTGAVVGGAGQGETGRSVDLTPESERLVTPEPQGAGSPEESTNANHRLHSEPWFDDGALFTVSPSTHRGSIYSFSEAAAGRLKPGSRWYDPRTSHDGCVWISTTFFVETSEFEYSAELIDCMEVYSSQTRSAWRFTPVEHDTGSHGTLHMIVPYNPRDVLVVRAYRSGLRVGEGLLTDMGLGKGNYGARRTLSEGGRVEFEFEPLENLQSFNPCTITIQDGNLQPIDDAFVLYGDYCQVVGRSDSLGRVSFRLPGYRGDTPLPGSAGASDARNFVTVWKPGYVPVFVERAFLQKQNWNVGVQLKTKELLVSLPAQIDPACLIRDRSSGILLCGNDLLPLPDSVSGDTWEGTVRPWLSGSDGNKVEGASVERGWSFSGKEHVGRGVRFYIEGLEQALGEPRREQWPYTYGNWYCNRWVYEDGVVTASLPYAGKFLLLLGEGLDVQKDAGTLTHALYIDARDPKNVTGRLLTRPGY